MTKRSLRCAIYTRKSSEEGLDQAFNSLDAQREACEAYIRSQRHEGWQLVPDRFDDGGISGGTLNRPALQSLLNEISAQHVQVVIVYKVDRLTRSLADFAKLVELFDGNGVSFVSVTQQFNTTSSMGRLTLNVLLSFAQFEREVTGERIRDKIAASKAKGMWMGGVVPLGYRSHKRTLTIDLDEAAMVRKIFGLYQETGSVDQLRHLISAGGIRTRSGKPFSRGNLYRILQNPVYIGEIQHKSRRYPGQHSRIIEQLLWDAVQTRLATNRIMRREGGNAAEPSLLAGKLFNAAGVAFTPDHAVKRGRRYRYYALRGVKSDSGSKSPRRLPAQEIESCVTRAIGELLGSPQRLIKALGITGGRIRESNTTLANAQSLLQRLSTATERFPLIRTLLSRVIVADNEIRLEIDLGSLRGLLDVAGDLDGSISIAVPIRIRSRGVEVRLVVASEERHTANPDPLLIKAVVRAFSWWQMRLASPEQSIEKLAAANGINERYFRHVSRLAFLAPDIIEGILAGKQPIWLTAERLIRLPELPMAWPAQRLMLGINEFPQSR